MLSGGLDSAVSLACAIIESEVCLGITIDYGQLAAIKEIEAAEALAGYYQIPHKIISLPFLREISDSALVCADLPMPEPELAELMDPATGSANMADVWIPNRNGLFVNIAASFAEAYGAGLLVTGFNREEAAFFPDNSEEFVAAVNKCLEYSVNKQLKVVSYTQRLDKVDIIKLGRRLAVPFRYIWSCYRGGSKMCGKCESCRRLERAAREAGIDIKEI